MPQTSPAHRLGSLASPCPTVSRSAAARATPSRGRGLQLTRGADYAVRCLIHLAMQPAGSRLSQVDIAAAIGAPAPFVGKVMQQLALAGLVTSHRGVGGGFALHPAAGETTMLDAVTAVDGPIALNSCLSPDEPCWRASFCPAHLVWHDAQRRVVDVLRSATISALARQVVGAGVTTPPPSAESDPRRHTVASDEIERPRARTGRSPRIHLRKTHPHWMGTR